MESTLFLDSTSSSVVESSGGGFDVRVLCCPSPEHPERNEDAAGIWFFPDGSLVLAVADGMGGTPAGQRASRLAIECLDETLRAAAQDVSIRRPVLDAFEAANLRVLEQAPGSGTTLVAVELAAETVRTYNVGDSGVLLVGQRGRLKAQTTDHSPVGYGVAAGLIDAEAAMEHEDRHILSNFVGHKEMHIELGIPRTSAPRDTILLASDGLFDNLALERIIETIRCGDLGKSTASLGQEVIEKMEAAQAGRGIGKPDDLTIVLVRRKRT